MSRKKESFKILSFQSKKTLVKEEIDEIFSKFRNDEYRKSVATI
jgi:uncharacterized protein YlzI (FlbEa/FlbD family)